MLKEIYVAALGMTPQQTKLEVTANNIANANTTGFKREGVFQKLIEEGQTLANTTGNVEQEDTPLGQYTDFRQGAFKKTANQFDVAIQGNGFFVVEDDEGNPFLTRNGHFTLSPEGKLITHDGKSVVVDGGTLFVRRDYQREGFIGQDEKPLEVRVKENGDIFINEQLVSRFNLVDVPNPQTLKKVNATQYVATEGTEIGDVPDGQVRMKQGYLESSNVDIMKEMIEMIQLQRHFQLGQKVIDTNDRTIDRSIGLSRIV
jgi:flagellar basal body rod protein FlgG